jgi:hypothetical protein
MLNLDGCLFSDPIQKRSFKMVTESFAHDPDLGAVAQGGYELIVAYFDLGMQASQIVKDATNETEALLAFAGTAVVPVSLVRAAIKFARWLQDKGAVKKLLDRRGIDGFRLSWQHIVQLLNVRNVWDRESVLDVCFAEGLKPRDIARMTRPRRKKAPKAGVARKANTQLTTAASPNRRAGSHVNRFFRTWRRIFSKALFSLFRSWKVQASNFV